MVELIESSRYPVGFYSVGMAVDDMEKAMANYKALGARILAEPVPITGGSLAFIEDPNGVRIAIVNKTDWRQLKPSIPLLGEEGIPLRDEIEFEIEL